MGKKDYAVYILTNPKHTVLYTGVTNNLYRRIYEHRYQNGSRFTSKYKTTYLVYFEEFKYINSAIQREKQIKSGSRKNKEELINEINPGWLDLAADWFDKWEG